MTIVNEARPARLSGTLFFNRTSGSFDPLRLEALREQVEAAGVELEEVRPTEGDIRDRIATKLAAGQKLFIVAGGDGTIHYAAQALVGTGTTLAVLPVGTFNHLARDLHIPLEWDGAIDVALNGETREIDVGVVNGRYFLNNILLGLYPEIVTEREKLRRWYGKWRAYARATRYALQRFPHVSVQIETADRLEAIKTHVFAVSVNRYDLTTLGVIAPKTSLNDGRLSVYWLPYMSKPAFIGTFARYLRGRMRPGDELRFISTVSINVRAAQRRLRLGIDGELAEIETPLRVSIVPGGLRVKVPAERALA
jgi:diacylglycerol kinase family enzyme